MRDETCPPRGSSEGRRSRITGTAPRQRETREATKPPAAPAAAPDAAPDVDDPPDEAGRTGSCVVVVAAADVRAGAPEAAGVAFVAGLDAAGALAAGPLAAWPLAAGAWAAGADPRSACSVAVRPVGLSPA